jgi:hypothetical protein
MTWYAEVGKRLENLVDQWGEVSNLLSGRAARFEI